VTVWSKEGAAFSSHGGSGVVADFLILPGEFVEQGGLSGIRISDQGNPGLDGSVAHGFRWLGGDDADLVGKVFAQGEAGATDGAKHIASVGDLANPHFFAKTDLAELTAGRALEIANLEVATNRGLTEGQGGIEFKFGSEDWHGGLMERKLIETVSQQQNELEW
jgi:hypothetical protein